MSWLGDAMKTIESVVLLRSKVEQLDRELEKTNKEIRALVGGMIAFDKRLIRLEVIEEMRGNGPRTVDRLIEEQ